MHPYELAKEKVSDPRKIWKKYFNMLKIRRNFIFKERAKEIRHKPRFTSKSSPLPTTQNCYRKTAPRNQRQPDISMAAAL